MPSWIRWIPAAGLLLAGCSSGGRTPHSGSPPPAAAVPAASTETAIKPAPPASPKGSTQDPAQRVLCQWHNELTPDGRNIQVPTYYLVDEHGRVIRRLKTHEVK